MKPIESDALVRLYRTLGLPGGSVAVRTMLDDGNVAQVLSINEVVRRSRTLAANTGWFRCAMVNVHSAADDESSTVNPYEPGSGINVAPYPEVVPNGFDFWILNASLRQIAGAAGITSAVLVQTPGLSQIGWALDDSGASVSGNQHQGLASWASLLTVAGQHYGLSGDGGVLTRLLLRVPRGATLQFRSTSPAAATYECQLMCGLFTEGLGQDVAQ